MKSSLIVSLSRGSITSFSKVLAVMLCLSVQLMFCKHFCVMAVLPLKLCLPRCMRQYWSSKEIKLTGSRLPFYIFAQSSLFFLKKSTGTQNIYWVQEETVTTTLLKKHSIISIAKHLSFAEKNGAGLKSTRHSRSVEAWAPRCGPFHAWWHFEALRPSTPAPSTSMTSMTSQIHRHFKVFLLSLGKAWERPIKRALNVVQHRWTPCHFYSPNEHLQLRFRHGSNGSQEQRRDATRLQRTECFKRNILYFLDAHLTKPIQVSTCTVNPGLTRHSDKWVIVTINIGTLHIRKKTGLYQFINSGLTLQYQLISTALTKLFHLSENKGIAGKVLCLLLPGGAADSDPLSIKCSGNGW